VALCHRGEVMAKQIKRKLSFREMAVGELRRHRWCGDAFPENGWPSVNLVLAQYALEKRIEKPNTVGCRGSGRKPCIGRINKNNQTGRGKDGKI